MERPVCNRGVAQVDNGPGGASRASEEGERDEPSEEKDEDVEHPYARILEPRGILVQIRRWLRIHIQTVQGY